MIATVTLTVLMALGFLFQESAQANGFFQTFKAAVTIQESPPSISFAWTFQPYIQGTLKRRALPSVESPVMEAWQTVKPIPMGSTSITDTTAVVGVAYEYAIEFANYRYAYVAAGIRLPLEESRGKILLMVDQTMATPCAAELDRLQQDLVGDGWQVIRHNVPRDDGNYSTRHQAKSVKATIVADYQADPANVKAVLLFGHVPVPYSGWDIPDGHEFRTLNADAYYGDMTGEWTDNTVSNIAVSTGVRGSNIPGDGKFDQNVLPGNVDLMVGRVDLYKMPAFQETETTLLKRYLAKDHAWRHRRFTVQPIGLVNWGRGWNWGPYNTVRQLTDSEYTFGDGGLWNVNGRSIKNSYGFDFQRMLNRQSCLHAYTGNTGGWTMAGMVSTADMAAGNILAVFMTEGGSWSVEWDYQDSLMRSFLAASGYSLCGAWSEYPGTYLHHMAAGRPLGLSMRVWQNATWIDYVEDWSCMRAVYLALQGDPTVRLHNVAPPSQLTAASATSNVLLNWTASTDPDVVGYHIYRANGMTSPFIRLNSDTPVAGTNYTDSTARSTNVVYMVRAVKLEQSVSASYWNISQGAFVPFRLDGSSNRLPTANGQTLQVPEAAWVKINMTGSDPDGDPLTYVINEMPVNGQITGGPVNFVYTPYLRDEIRPNANGPDRLTFTVHDAWGASAPAEVSLTIVPDSKRIVTSLDNLGGYFRVPEGGAAPFQVKLAAQPASNTVVTVARTSGNITVQSGASLTFTTNNWNMDQTVTLGYVDSLPNADSAQAFITCSAPGLTTNTFRILEYDNDSTLEVSTTAGGTVSLLGTNLVTTGAAIPISATASNGFAFLYWTCTFGDTTIADLYAPTTTITVAETSLQQLAQIKAVFLNNKALVTSLSQVSIPEGGTNTFQVRLASQPASNTVVTLTSEYYSDVDITFQSGATLTFTPGNWNTWQTVTLAAAQDDLDQFDGYAWITCSASGWNDGYVTAYEEDNDAYLTMVAGAGGSVVPSGILMATMGVATNISAVANPGYTFANWTVLSGQATVGNGTAANTTLTIGSQASVQANFIDSSSLLMVTENIMGVAEGGTATFQVKLAAQPVSSTVVTVARTDGDADMTVQSGASLTFTPVNWGLWQTVTLEAAPDADSVDGSATITCSAPGQSDVTVTATEQDSDATLTVTAGSGGTTVPSGSITVPKGQSTDIAATANTGYTFTNWTVTNGTAAIVNTMAATTAVVLTNTAMIQARFTLNAVAILRSVTATNVPEGGTVAFQVRLSAQPTGTVTVAVARTAGDTNITVQSGASLTFTTNNWATDQIVTLAASQDADTLNGSATVICSASGRASVSVIVTEVEDDATLTVVAGAGGSTVPSGAGVVTQGAATVLRAIANFGYGFTHWTVTSGSAAITDSQAAETTVTITNAATVRAQFVAQGLALLTSASYVGVPEGGTAQFRVGLTEPPASTMTVTVARSAGDADLTVRAGSSLTFTPENWAQWQSVTLAAAADADSVKGSATITCSAAGVVDVGVTATEREIPVAKVDTDGDGMSDEREVQLGRNPNGPEVATLFPFVERFETDTVSLGDLNGQHGWVAVPGGEAQVQAEDVAEGAQALRISGSTVAAVSQAFTGALQTVWLDLRQKVSATTAPASVPNAALALFFNTRGQLVVCDGARPAGSEWTVLSNHTAQTAGAWVRINARLDYATQTWDLYLNGSCVASALGFAAPKQRLACLTFEGKSGAVDNLQAGYALPAGLTIPESWYLDYFGHLGYADEDDPDGDRASNLEEYLAGTNPNDPASCFSLTGVGANTALAQEFIVRWQSVTGRMYTLQAATNLVTGFTVDLGAHIPATPPINVHTDAVNGAAQKFYKVRLE